VRREGDGRGGWEGGMVSKGGGEAAVVVRKRNMEPMWVDKKHGVGLVWFIFFTMAGRAFIFQTSARCPLQTAYDFPAFKSIAPRGSATFDSFLGR